MDTNNNYKKQSDYLRMGTTYLLEGVGLVLLIDGSMSDRVGEGLLGISTYLVARAAGDIYKGLLLKKELQEENKATSELEKKVNE